MKNLIYLLLLFILPVTVLAQQKESTLSQHSKEIRLIIKNEDGVIRGYEFGTPRQKIKDSEDAEFISEGKDYMIYKVSITEKEYADIIYYLDEKETVKGFGIAFIENVNTQLEKTLIDDFEKYFTERYGKFVANDRNDEVWTSKDGTYTVEMGDSSEGGDLIEIEIEIFKKENK